MCGIVGVWNPERADPTEAARLTFFSLYALQHRGQESAGIAAERGRAPGGGRRQGAAGRASALAGPRRAGAGGPAAPPAPPRTGPPPTQPPPPAGPAPPRCRLSKKKEEGRQTYTSPSSP